MINITDRKKTFFVFFLLLGILLCGFGFNQSEMILDTEQNIVYQNLSIDKIFTDFAADKDSAKNKYNHSRIVLCGKVSEIAKKYKTIILTAANENQEGTLKCSFSDKNLTAYVKTLSQGDLVKVYGKFSISIINNNLNIDVSKIEKITADTTIDTCYSLLNGKTIDQKNLSVRTLADKKITYYIPAEWSEIEYNIVDNSLGVMEGYQYRLDEIPQSAAVHPESLFVGYFDNQLLKFSSDKNKTDLIERSIIANILNKKADSLAKFPAKKIDTYYGAKYQYYQDAYKDNLGQGYHVEFVFQKLNTDGILVYLYVYYDPNHIDDIMFLMRLLEMK